MAQRYFGNLIFSFLTPSKQTIAQDTILPVVECSSSTPEHIFIRCEACFCGSGLTIMTCTRHSAQRDAFETKGKSRKSFGVCAHAYFISHCMKSILGLFCLHYSVVVCRLKICLSPVGAPQFQLMRVRGWVLCIWVFVLQFMCFTSPSQGCLLFQSKSFIFFFCCKCCKTQLRRRHFSH